MTTYCNRRERRGIYRSRNGMIFGVCRGLADHLDVSSFWFRAGAVLFLLSSFGTAIIVYIALAFLMKLEPASYDPRIEAELASLRPSASASAAEGLKQTFDRLNSRIQRMESVVTSRERDWEQRLNS